MNKCLVTKLNGSSNNSELLRLGEMRMKILKVQNPTDHTQGFSLGSNKPVTLEIVSDGYFTDKTLSENKGKRITLNAGINSVWVNGDKDIEIAILNKYSLTAITSSYQGEASDVYGNNIKLNISDLKYSAALTDLNLANTQVSGNIGDLKTLTALTNLSLANTQVSGNIGDLKTLTALTNLSLYNTQISGNISELKTLTALTYLNLYNAKIPLTGNISELSTLSKCTEMNFKYSKLIGDLATLPASCRFASFGTGKGSVFTWSNRLSTAKIIAIEGNASVTNIDKMLQDQAQCQVGFKLNDSTWYKTISVAGNRTSASDAAVSTLQSKGYTVSIISA
jgi:Leucine-rich repeat (LRR) protein